MDPYKQPITLEKMCKLKIMQKVIETHYYKNFKSIHYECRRRIETFLSRRISHGYFNLVACSDYGYIRHKYKFRDNFKGFPFLKRNEFPDVREFAMFFENQNNLEKVEEKEKDSSGTKRKLLDQDDEHLSKCAKL